MNKKAYAFFLKKNRPRRHNPVAVDLSDGRYHQRVVKDKKKYNRKGETWSKPIDITGDSNSP
jgi:hypothetical protein